LPSLDEFVGLFLAFAFLATLHSCTLIFVFIVFAPRFMQQNFQASPLPFFLESIAQNCCCSS